MISTKQSSPQKLTFAVVSVTYGPPYLSMSNRISSYWMGQSEMSEIRVIRYTLIKLAVIYIPLYIYVM